MRFFINSKINFLIDLILPKGALYNSNITILSLRILKNLQNGIEKSVLYEYII